MACGCDLERALSINTSFFAYRMSAAHSRAMTYYVRSDETQSTRSTLSA